jgi:hypothetical protein
MRHLRHLIDERVAKNSYSRYTPIVERIMNSSIHKSTGFSPAQILFGNSVDLNKNTVLAKSSDDKQNISMSQWINELKTMQETILLLAKEHFKEDITEEKIRHLLAWYARLLLGKEILECVEENGQCAFTAEL